MRCHLQFAVSDGSAGNDHDNDSNIRICSSARSIERRDDTGRPLRSAKRSVNEHSTNAHRAASLTKNAKTKSGEVEAGQFIGDPSNTSPAWNACLVLEAEAISTIALECSGATNSCGDDAVTSISDGRVAH
jgi:hypothetical protein